MRQAVGAGVRNTLAERAMIPEGFANTPNSRMDMPVEVIGSGRYLKVDQSASLRANSVTSNGLSGTMIEASEYLIWWTKA